MADFLGYEQTDKNREIPEGFEKRFGCDASVTMTEPDWPNFEPGPATKVEKPGSDAGPLAHVKYYLPKGRFAAQELIGRYSHSEFKSLFGAAFDSLEPDQDINPRLSLWRSFIEQEFRKDPELQIPQTFEFANRSTSFWMTGFTRELKRVLALALKAE
ncbi:MAG: hypothetical protein ACYDHG_03355 [Desulfomonilaceae bacterium]